MKKIKDGGPAFSAAAFDQNDNVLEWQSGMSLRDYFAAKAMPRFILEYNSQEGSARAYAWADAMLKARGQG